MIDIEEEVQDVEGTVLATHERDWDTEEVIRVNGDLFYRRTAGGCQGSYNRQRGDGSWDSSPMECREIGCSEARRILLGFGLEPNEVSRLTR